MLQSRPSISPWLHFIPPGPSLFSLAAAAFLSSPSSTHPSFSSRPSCRSSPTSINAPSIASKQLSNFSFYSSATEKLNKESACSEPPIFLCNQPLPNGLAPLPPHPQVAERRGHTQPQPFFLVLFKVVRFATPPPQQQLPANPARALNPTRPPSAGRIQRCGRLPRDSILGPSSTTFSHETLPHNAPRSDKATPCRIVPSDHGFVVIRIPDISLSFPSIKAPPRHSFRRICSWTRRPRRLLVQHGAASAEDLLVPASAGRSAPAAAIARPVENR